MDSPSFKLILEFVMQTLIIIATPILIMLAHKVAKEFSKRTGIALAEQQTIVLDDAITKGIAYAHEQSRKALKLDLPAIPGDAKRSMAINFVLDTLQEYKIPEKSKDYLSSLVEARLHMERPLDDTGKA